MKKILIFSLAYYPLVGGAEIAVKEITDRLADFDYYMITNRFSADWPAKEKLGRINIFRVGNGRKIDKYLYPWRALALAKKLHKTIRFDFSWSIMPFYAGLAALFFRYGSKVPYLLTDQSGDSDEFLKKRTWFWEFYYKRIYRRAKYTQVISKYLGQRSRQMGYKGEIFLVPNGVDLNIFREKLSPEEKSARRKELGIAPNETFLVTTSRLAMKNGLDDLIKAMNFMIYKMGLGVKLVILGKGPNEKMLKDLAESQGVGDQVLFLGHRDYKELPIYVEAADIFIRPSLSEGLGNSFLEAMAVGTPIIATPVGGIPDFLTADETGLFCQVRNPASIAQAVEKYVNNPDLYQKIKEQGQKLVLEKYSWDNVAKKMNKIFTEKM